MTSQPPAEPHLPAGSAAAAPESPAPEQLRRTRAAAAAAEEVHRQAIRDAAAAGLSVTDIAAALQVSNRRSTYAALAREPVPDVTDPGLRPVVYLRGAGADRPTWQAIAQALHRRGFTTVQDRTQAWHLARGRTPVVLVDFSTGRDTTDVLITQVAATYAPATRSGPVSRRISPADRARLHTAAAHWLDTTVHWTEETPELSHDGPTHRTPADPDQIARTVHHAIQATPGSRRR